MIQYGKTLEDIEKVEKIETEHEIKEYTTLSKEAPQSIPEDQTFDTIKNILKEASGRNYSSNITLNTRIDSYLYTEDKRIQFKSAISSAFNISYDEVDKLYKKNKLVWDWVNEFRD
jgi:hypothetical protein